METKSSEQIINNCDILYLIFKHLDLREQLKLTKICQQFEDAIVYSLWRVKCKNLQILQTYPNTLLISNKTTNKIPFTDKEVDTFLYIISSYIIKLELNFVEKINNKIRLKYNKLTTITFQEIVLKNCDFKKLAENCLNLQSLSVIKCINFKGEPLKMDRDIQLENLWQMKSLNELNVRNSGHTQWNFEHIRQLFNIKNLRILNIKSACICESTKSSYNAEILNEIYGLEDLTIGNFCNCQTWQSFIMEDLKRFRNLIKLSIVADLTVFLTINDIFLEILSTECPQLADLSLSQFKLFINEIPLMGKLQKLTINCCFNLKFTNLNRIFLKLNLKYLSIINTTIKEWNSNCYLSTKTLKHLIVETTLKTNLLSIFLHSSNKFENVSALTLSDKTYSKQCEAIHLSHIFPYLRELILDTFYISIEDIICLKYLKILKFNLFDHMSWSYLEILFQHPQLTHITIDTSLYGCNSFEKHYERLPKTCECLTTTLEYLCIPLIVYKRALDFWPKFMLRNKNLKLDIIDHDISQHTYLHT